MLDWDESQWIEDAMRRKNISGAELGRQVVERYGVMLNKQIVSDVRGGERRLKALEAVAISKVTGHPLPAFDDKEPPLEGPANDPFDKKAMEEAVLMVLLFFVRQEKIEHLQRVAATVVETAIHPLEDSLGTDKLSKVRNQVAGTLRGSFGEAP